MSPALAGDLSKATMLSDQEMDGIVGGVVVQTILRTGNIIGYNNDNPDQPIYRTIDMTGKGPEKLLTGNGPNNNGVNSFQDFDVATDPPLPPGFSITVDGTVVGTPSGVGGGAAFLTVNFNTP